MADTDGIQRRLKEDRIPEAFWPEEWGEKKKRPREVAIVDVNLCFPCLKCPEFCPVGCIEQLRPGTLSGRGDNQPVQVRFEECIGCYICVEVCALLTDYDAIRMYPTDLVEQALGATVGDGPPAEHHPPRPWEEFAEGGPYRELGNGSRIAQRMSAEEKARAGFKR